MISSIDDVEMDVDFNDAGRVVATLVLHGDFMSACEDYLDTPNSGKLRLRISREMAENLVKEVGKYL